MTFDELAAQMLSAPAHSLGTGATEEEIDAVERAVQVPIRGGYRKFLRRFGWGSCFCDELFGIGTGVPHHLDLVCMTESERTEMYPPIPIHLLPVWNNGGGDHACLDTSANPEEPPVVMWWHEDGPDQVPQPEAADFVSWLARLIEERKRNG